VSPVRGSNTNPPQVHDVFEAMDVVLRTHPKVGAYNQKI
jgi:hypothetical protein